MVRVVHKSGFWFAVDFACAARRYWLAVFPRVAREVCRRRALATCIPDPALRGLALEALDRKRDNLDGAAAFAALVPAATRPFVVKALVACQTICDYLDLLSEQPCSDPVANGHQLHEALIVAITPGSSHCDYYLHHDHRDDGGYLRTLVGSVREALAALPLLSLMAEPMRRAAERIVAYQSLNHGDTLGSYEPFKRWASAETVPLTGLHWWETGAGAGSTLTLYVLIASASDSRLGPSDVRAIENTYFPWVGALHSLLDSLVDHDEDRVAGERGLIDCYPSPVDAAVRMQAIACEALRRAAELPGGRRHALIVAAMTSFYICEVHRSASPHAQLVARSVLDAIGGLAMPTMAVLAARRSLRCVSLHSPRSGRILVARGEQRHLESQVSDFPVSAVGDRDHHVLVTNTMPIRSVSPGGRSARPQSAEALRLRAGPSVYQPS